MRNFLLISLITTLAGLQAQNTFFDPEKLTETGVYYYPEAWDPAQWDRDLKKMADMGFEFTHFGEFAWAQMEPSEGRYDFSWLDKALELAHKNGLKVILCTPVATPPVWLVRKYPEVLVKMADGQLAQHGTRAHYSWSSTKYRELTTLIVEELGKRYGNDTRVWGWQLDNEPSHYGTIDYSDAAEEAFKLWLKKKYGTIEALNKAWGTAFWSGVYSSFSEIELPNPSRMYSGTASPTSMVDMKRFHADEAAAFLSLQNLLLKKHISPKQFVTTNFMHEYTNVDPWRSTDLDFISYTAYLVAGHNKGVGPQGFRMGDPWRISFANDFFNTLNGITGVMELQPGQVNWGRINPQPYPGVVRSWLWNAFAGGLKFICSYRFRQPLYGGEQFHYGMVGTDGVSESTGGKQYRQFMTELRELRKQYKPGAVMPADYAARTTAILYNVENLWETSIQPQTYQWDQKAFIFKYYGTLKSLSVPVKFVRENDDLSHYPYVVIPAYQMVTPELVHKWEKYAREGGHLIITLRTALKDKNGHFFEAPWASLLRTLIGAKIKMNDMLDGTMQAWVKTGNTTYNWNNWGDMLEPGQGTASWATYADQFYAGMSAVTHHKLGKGTVTYIGTDTDDGLLEKDVLKKVYTSTGVAVKELPEGVIVNWRDGFWVVNNYSSEVVNYSVPLSATVLVGSSAIAPAGVFVYR
jgi:beta-galactosidase